MRKFFNKTIIQLFSIILTVILVSSILVYFFEHKTNEQYKTFFDTIFWAVVTITTTGYGNQVPTTISGMIIAIIIMLLSVFMIGIMTGKIASSLLEASLKRRRGLMDF